MMLLSGWGLGCCVNTSVDILCPISMDPDSHEVYIIKYATSTVEYHCLYFDISNQIDYAMWREL